MSHHREAIKRLNSDLKKFNEKPTPGISIAISESNALELFARYDSLPNTPYDGLYPILKITAT
jgi:ubiquitin-protein ligase